MRKIMKYKLKLDYTADELKELRRLGEDYDSPMNAVREIADIVNGSYKVKDLQKKYSNLDYEDEFDFMVDINSAVMGTAIFPEEKYVVHDKVTDRYICFNRLTGSFCWSQLRIPETNSRDYWLEINSAYEPMLERVED